MLAAPLFAKAEYETPPYDIKIYPIDENFREAYYAIDRLRLVTSPITYVSETGTNRFCIDFPTLCVDALNNRVGIGTGTPSGVLAIYGSQNTNNEVSLIVENGGTGFSFVNARNQPNGNYALLGAIGSGATGNFGSNIPKANLNYMEFAGGTNTALLVNAGPLLINTGSSSPIYFRTNNSTAVAISASGEITQPLQPCFSVRLSSTNSNVTGNGTAWTANFLTENFDQGNDFASNVFTAPIDGRYLLSVHLFMSGQDAGTTDGNLRVVTSNRTYYGTAMGALLSNNPWTFTFTGIVDMDANDTAHVIIALSGGTKVADATASDGGGTYALFSGSLIN